jgi:hypothetical protein
MFSEITTENNIKTFVKEIKKELKTNSGKPEVVVVLKKLGRFVLSQFEWDVPKWTKEYEKLFKE